jgi:hypothetical protein
MVDDLVKLASPSDLPIDFKHIAIIFAVDKTATGKVSLQVGTTAGWGVFPILHASLLVLGQEFLEFAQFWSLKRKLRPRHEFEAEIRGACVLHMVRAIRERGLPAFVQWCATPCEATRLIVHYNQCDCHRFLGVLSARFPPRTRKRQDSQVVSLLHCDAVVIFHTVRGWRLVAIYARVLEGWCAKQIMCGSMVGALPFREFFTLLQQASEAQVLPAL